MALGFNRSKQQGEMSTPVIVQGVAVPQQQYGTGYATATPAYGSDDSPNVGKQYNSSANSGGGAGQSENFDGVKGEVQPARFNDVMFSIAFIAHLLAVTIMGAIYGQGIGNGGGGGYHSYAMCAVVCGLFAMGLSSMALGFMMKFPTELIKTGLFFSIGLSLTIGILGLISGQILMAVMGLLSSVIGCCYAYFVWSRIPFAAANMNTALTAVKANMGLTMVAYFFLLLAFAWSVWWAIAAGGITAALGQGGLFFLFVSYYWTHQVLQNTVHVTTAGVVGTWWFEPAEASSFCSPAIKDSFIRATTFSFGSICMGSLLVALVQALRQVLYHAQQQDDCQMLVCLIDCVLSCIQGIIEELNRWAYTYIGLYGYNYLDAGRNVITLFQNKGWTSIISENLVDNVLLMLSVAVGLITGLVGALVAQTDQNMFQTFGIGSGPGGFLLGFLVGLIIASVLMNVVGGAVNTVIVCFAESPREFQRNHPQLSNEMRSAWTEAWPGEYTG